MSKPAISIQGLRKEYKQGLFKNKVLAVDDLSMTISEGSVVGLIGSNGAGKTTTIYCILGTLLPDEGEISIFGHPPQSLEARRRIGFQSEIFNTYDFLKPEKALSFYGKLAGMESRNLSDQIEEKLSRLGLTGATNQKVKSFSKGMNQRLGIAQALLHDPDLLLLDEPFTGLDPQGRREIVEIIQEEKSKGKTIFFSSHILSDIERVCDKVIMMRKGKIVLSGDIDQVTSITDKWCVSVKDPEKKISSLMTGIEYEIDDYQGKRDLLVHQSDKERTLQLLLDSEVKIIGLHPKMQSLEELYLKLDNEDAS
ncbi:MAG: ABC transporter ATP-binding protein [Candidatus Halalkalibacterium sp. M3_1C_030]